MCPVPQTDIHSPNITVFESLQFSASLRFTNSVEKDIQAAFVEEVGRCSASLTIPAPPHPHTVDWLVQFALQILRSLARGDDRLHRLWWEVWLRRRQVLKLVELDAVRGNIVGKPGESGLSVEQRKRLTIAVELVANPPIVFMCPPPPSPRARFFSYDLQHACTHRRQSYFLTCCPVVIGGRHRKCHSLCRGVFFR